MEQQMYKVQIDGEERSFPAGTTYLQIAGEYQERYPHDIVLVYVNGKLQELGKKLKKDCELQFVTTGETIGNLTYRRGVSFLLVKAVYDTIGHDKIEQVRIHFSVDKGYYCTIKGDQKLDQELLARIEERMHEMADMDLSIRKRSVHTDEAVEMFRKYGMKDKERLFRYRRVSTVNIYSINEFEDYYYGYMVPSTGYLKYFKLYLYDEGFVVQMPEAAEPEKIPPFQPQNKLFHVLKESTRGGDMLGIETVGALNDYVTGGSANPKELLLVQEAMQEKKIAQIAEQIAGNPQKKFVLIAGPSSSGKTTFSRRLSIQLRVSGLVPHPISVDDYFKNRVDTPLDAEGKPNYECLEALDVELFNHDMNELLAGKRVNLPVFNFKTGKREWKGKKLRLEKDSVIIAEGLHALNPVMLPENVDMARIFRLYVSPLLPLNLDDHNRIPTSYLRLLRRIVRDYETRGSSVQHTLSMWESVQQGEKRWIFPFQENADMIFNSSTLYELAVLKKHIYPLLAAVQPEESCYDEVQYIVKILDYIQEANVDDEIPPTSLIREFIGGNTFYR
mgnify:CR=1 FL=1